MLRRSVLRLSAPTITNSARGALRAPLAFTIGQSYHQFELLSQRAFPELNLTSYEFVHSKTKARYFHFDTPDTNNTFCIGFGTPAQNSKGTTHVLEHTALCGSKQYPVRDPFFHMLRRSLSTFMNAMTGADYTMYPFATTNAQDFSNLLNVYTDAVLFPLLRAEDFRQEGHRLEVKEAEGEKNEGDSSAAPKVGINGVVYNEMRGVVSEPSTFLSHELMKTMLPGTHYTHVSGGFPPNILELTHEELVAFHREHYHPSNSMTITYGDLPPEVHMKKLDDMFSLFEPSRVVPIPQLVDANRRTAESRTTAQGPLDPMGNPEEQARVALSFACPSALSSLDDMVRMVVLDSLLTQGPSSPMYQALLESKLGSRYCPMGGFAYYLSSPIVTYGVEGVSVANVKDKEAQIHAAVLKTLEDAKNNGFDQRRVQSVVFQEELQQRHRSANYGIGVCTTLCALGLVRPNINPTDFINWLPHLKRIESSYKDELLPLLESAFLKNPHRTLLTVEPSPSYLTTLQKTLDDKEVHWNEVLSLDEKKRVAKETEEWRQRIRKTESADCLPTLRVQDIPRAAFQEPLPIQRPAPAGSHLGIHTISHPTNGLVYVHGLIPFASSLVDQLRGAKTSAVDPLIPMYFGFLGATGAGSLDFKELSIAAELVSGGFQFTPLFTNSSAGRGDFTAGLSYGFYTTREKLQPALDLLHVILTEPRLNDDQVRSRIHTMATARCSRTVQSITRSGNAFATTSAASTLTNHAAIREAWGGLTHCSACSSLLEGLKDANGDSVSKLLEQYKSIATEVPLLMNRGGYLWATCEPDAADSVGAQLNAFSSRFTSTNSTSNVEVHITVPPPVWSNAAGSAATTYHPMPIDTSFVGVAIPNNLKTLDRAQQAIRVGAQLLKNEYLHRAVREEGGAYGAAAASNLNGEVGGVAMSSYRDPTPDKTVEALSRASSVLQEAANVTQEKVDQSKLRLFAALDAPHSADSYGQALFLHGTTNELRQQVRDILLGITPQDIMDSAKYFDLQQADSRVAVLKPLEKPAASAE
ncbi:pitrilysin-like metalloprotease, putative [Bodo saltans]|uniref:Pitrilysin-like metalloprotease, putative n=1 Tax=Bodo saltans TaxID=75058 RepID=A0A0S4IK68_BODSA|nr:pitrilysin-like metalloprotease, putative [Bodo saltans]|eukprot:CUF02698.1 pitrilysin-like metalloprotease, putative [Bodo saltans]